MPLAASELVPAVYRGYDWAQDAHTAASGYIHTIIQRGLGQENVKWFYCTDQRFYHTLMARIVQSES